MNTKYTELTPAQKLALSNAEFEQAVKLEAVERRIALPVTLSDELKRTEFRGFNIPADSVSFYELVAPAQYSGVKGTGVCYKTEAEAMRALDGVVAVDEEGYGGNTKNVLRQGQWSIRAVFVTLHKGDCYVTKLEEFQAGTTDEFDAVAKECAADWGAICQADYNNRVNGEKKAQYITLAQSNEEIAKAFWNKAEGTPWPDENAPLTAAVNPVPPSEAESADDAVGF